MIRTSLYPVAFEELVAFMTNLRTLDESTLFLIVIWYELGSMETTEETVLSNAASEKSCYKEAEVIGLL